MLACIGNKIGRERVGSFGDIESVQTTIGIIALDEQAIRVDTAPFYHLQMAPKTVGT